MSFRISTRAIALSPRVRGNLRERQEDGLGPHCPFVGSGTTIIAAERQGRACWAMELEPRYVDASVKRWEDYTGGQARRE